MFEWTVLFPLVFLTTSLSWYASTPFPFKLHSPLPTSILKPDCYFLIRKEGKIEKEKEVEGKENLEMSVAWQLPPHGPGGWAETIFVEK